MSRQLTKSAATRVAAGAENGSGTDVCARCEGTKEYDRLNYMLCVQCDDETGPGTGVCRRCFGPKEETRLRSRQCRTCESGTRGDRESPVRTRTLRTDLPADVWDRLATEALRKGVPLGRMVRDLIVSRDERKYPGATASTVSRNED